MVYGNSLYFGPYERVKLASFEQNSTYQSIQEDLYHHHPNLVPAIISSPRPLYISSRGRRRLIAGYDTILATSTRYVCVTYFDQIIDGKADPYGSKTDENKKVGDIN